MNALEPTQHKTKFETLDYKIEVLHEGQREAKKDRQKIRDEMQDMRRELCGKIENSETRLEGKIEASKTRLEGKIEASETRLRSEIKEVKTELRDEMQELKALIIKNSRGIEEILAHRNEVRIVWTRRLFLGMFGISTATYFLFTSILYLW